MTKVEQNQAGPTAVETEAGTSVSVRLDNGQTETVTIRQLKVRQLAPLALALEDEPTMAELFCGKEKGWADTITRDSLEEIVIEGERINADFFVRWALRNQARQEKLMPGITEKAVRALLVSRLPTSSPEPPLKSA